MAGRVGRISSVTRVDDSVHSFGCRVRTAILNNVRCMRATTKRKIAKYWGYILVVVLYFAWFHFDVSPGYLIAISLLILTYSLFQAPVPCCAQTRENELCRNNAVGLLRGCHLESHKWQNARMLADRQYWSRAASGIFSALSGKAAAVSAAAASVSAVAAAVALFIK